jgi:fructose-bisphosphate aldolase class II
MLEADEAYYKEHKVPLFSSHMLDLSEESKEENIETCAKYLKRMAKIDLWLEMEARQLPASIVQHPDTS